MWALLLLALAYSQPSFLEKIAPLVKDPLVVKEVVLGKTVLDKPLTVYILTKRDFTSMSELQGREAVLLNSYMHAREPYSLQLMEGLAQSIAGKGQEGDVGEFLQEGVFLFYPFVNPDGYQLYTETASIDVRKNRNTGGVKCGSGLPGVDINRNFPANFGIIPESSRPCSEEYHGKAPFSQSEALVFKQLFETFRILIAIDIHSYGNEWIYPYASDLTGKRVKQHPLYPFYQSIKNQLTERRRKIRSCIESLGYIADGVYIDWALDQGALSFAFEVGSTFHSDRQSEIQRDIKAAINDFYLIFKRALPRYETKTHPSSLLLQSKSLSWMNITVEIGNRTQFIELGPGEQVQMQLEINDTSAKILNKANGQTQVLSLRLRNLNSVLTPTTVIVLILALLGGLLLSFYSRWQGLHRRYSNVLEASATSQVPSQVTAFEQQLSPSERQSSSLSPQ